MARLNLSIRIDQITIRPAITCDSVVDAERVLRAIANHSDVVEVEINREDVSIEYTPLVDEITASDNGSPGERTPM